jgi:hypothetical protein
VNVKPWGQDQAARRRADKLEHMREQVAAGDLVIRTMTDAERAAWATREAALPVEERDKRRAALAKRRAQHARLTTRDTG